MLTREAYKMHVHVPAQIAAYDAVFRRHFYQSRAKPIVEELSLVEVCRRWTIEYARVVDLQADLANGLQISSEPSEFRYRCIQAISRGRQLAV